MTTPDEIIRRCAGDGPTPTLDTLVEWRDRIRVHARDKHSMTRSQREAFSAEYANAIGDIDFDKLHELAMPASREAWRKAEALLDGREVNELRASEKRDYVRLFDEAEPLIQLTQASQELREMTQIEDTDRHVDPDPGWAGVGNRSGFGGREPIGDARFLTRDASLAEWTRAHQGHEFDQAERIDLGKLVRGMFTGDWRGADVEHRSMTEGSNSAGGFYVPTPLSTEILDLARNRTRVLQAGARTVPMLSQKLKVAKVASDPTVSWHSEGSAITPSDGSIGQVEFTAQTLTAIVKMSMEVVEDSYGLDDVVRSMLANAVALEFDRVALYGSGSDPEPEGLKNTSNVNISYLGGTAAGTVLTSYDPVLDSVYRVENANYAAGAAIMSPRTNTDFAKLKETSTAAPLARPPKIADLPFLSTNQVKNDITVGGDSDCSDIFVGQWDQLMLGMRTSLMIRPLMERYADNGEVALMAWFRGDVQVARTSAFDIITGITPST